MKCNYFFWRCNSNIYGIHMELHCKCGLVLASLLAVRYIIHICILHRGQSEHTSTFSWSPNVFPSPMHCVAGYRTSGWRDTVFYLRLPASPGYPYVRQRMWSFHWAFFNFRLTAQNSSWKHTLQHGTKNTHNVDTSRCIYLPYVWFTYGSSVSVSMHLQVQWWWV